ncbi:ParB/RepB/Spo0J family partition protein [Geomonas sp. RF6]|uniref:ParB/RepB/Spo0J family partition protein n=1 Tax=Geomonas sp. RF6 TaxID=2897342 RepID=UPI001E3572AA|nr:ParB/RepB/Spo0J family partition protein [Geomonas sp. RF6]UFS72107.1 ParB/RepB/Spo0J family partition protein [Geomonas sp. RF6]
MTQQKRFLKGKLYELSLSELRVDKNQPRKYIDEEALQELKTSIEKHGVLQPVLVRRAAEGGFVLVSGERRFQAALKAGLTTIPAIITDGDPAEVAIVENLLREDLTAVEEAEAIAKLKEAHNYRLSDLSRALGKAESTISEILSLVKLPEEIRDDCRSNPKASRKILLEISKQATHSKMKALYKRFKVRGASDGHFKARSRTRSVQGVDVNFVRRFTQRIDLLHLGNLDKEQSESLMADLEVLRSALSKKIRTLKMQPQNK